jgi:hypothetical protein
VSALIEESLCLDNEIRGPLNISMNRHVIVIACNMSNVS